MKTSLLLLSLALSATTLFSQTSTSEYTNIPKDESQATASFVDKTIDLHWEKGNGYFKHTSLGGEKEVTLKEGQHLIVSVQNPNTVEFFPKIGDQQKIASINTIETSHIEHILTYTYLSHPWPWYDWLGGIQSTVLIGGGESEIHETTDTDPIIFNFQAIKSGREVLTIYVDEKGPKEDLYCLRGRVNNSFSPDGLIHRYSFSIMVTVK